MVKSSADAAAAKIKYINTIKSGIYFIKSGISILTNPNLFIYSGIIILIVNIVPPIVILSTFAFFRPLYSILLFRIPLGFLLTGFLLTGFLPDFSLGPPPLSKINASDYLYSYKTILPPLRYYNYYNYR